MSYIGDLALESTLDTKFTTVTTTGAPTVLAGSPVISAYVGNNTTQLTAGITLSVDFDGVVGLNNVRVVATAANGYAAASNYQLVITTGTVGGTSVVGYVVSEFSIEARAALRPTVAARTLDVSAGGEAGVDWANVGSPTTALNLSGTNIDVDQVIATVSGNVTGSVGSVAGAVGSVTGAVGSVTGAVGSVTGAVGSVAGNVVGSVGSLATQAKADVNAEVVDSLATDTYAEPAQGAPGATVSLSTKLGFLYKFLRNKVTQDATTLKVFNDDAVTVDHKATVSDDATTYTRGEIATGP